MKKLQEQEMKAEVEVDQIDDTDDGDDVLTADVINDIGDIADDIYAIVFDKGAVNVSAEAAGKISQAHELLYDALETLDKDDDSPGPVTNPSVTESKKLREKTEQQEKNQTSNTREDPVKDDGGDEASYSESKTINRMRNLSMLGLIDRAAIPHLVRLIKDMHAGKNITAPQRRLAIGLLTGLIDIVTGDIVFNAARREIVKQGLGKGETG